MSESPLNPTGLLGHYAVDLLFAGDPGEVGAVAGGFAGRDAFEIAERGAANLTLRHREALERGAPPEWTLGEPAPIDDSALQPLLEQSWWWPDARAVAARCTHARRLADHLFVTLDHRRRIGMFQQVLAATLEALPCRAIAWGPSQQLVSPEDFLTTMGDEGFESPSPGALNVRLFRLDDDDGTAGGYLMDTLGLGALGLVDVQCRFRGIDPQEVSHVLQATALYQWQQGPAIRSGDSVQGPRPGDRWRCTGLRSLAEPERELLDLDPGFPFGMAQTEA
jgi:hypothetical protein